MAAGPRAERTKRMWRDPEYRAKMSAAWRARQMSTDNVALDFVCYVLEGLRPEERFQWLEQHCPKTAAMLSVRQHWLALTDLEESA